MPKISELPVGTTPTGTEIIPAVQGGTTVELTATQIGSAGTKISGVSYPASPSTNTVPVVTGANTVTYETVPILAGGTGQVTAPAAFDALSPTTTRGDIIFRNATTNARLAAGVSGYALIAAGAGADPAWAGFVQSGSNAVTRTWQNKVRELVSVADFGAIGDGTTDDTAAIQAALNSLGATGGAVIIPATFKCLVDTNISVPANCWIVGSPSSSIPGNNFAAAWANPGSTLILNSAATLLWQGATNSTQPGGGGIDGLLIRRKGMTFPVDVTGLAAFAGTAITIQGTPPGSSGAGPDGITVQNSVIVGFQTGILTKNSQAMDFNHLWIDVNNGSGIDIVQSGYLFPISHVHISGFTSEPLVAAGGSTSLLARTGNGLHTSGPNVDGLVVTHTAITGFGINLNIETGLTSVFDNLFIDGFKTAGSIGMAFGAATSGARVSNSTCWSNETSFKISGSANQTVSFDNVLTAESVNQAFNHVTGDLRINNSMITSTNSGWAINVNSAANRLDIDHIWFLNVSSSPHIFLPATADTSKIFIGDNIYTDAATTVGIAHANLVPVPIASASTISPAYGTRLAELTGTTTINTMNGGYLGRQIVFKVTSGLSFTTAGNITLPLTPYTVTAGSYVRFTGTGNGTWSLASPPSGMSAANITGLGTGVGTFLATPSSANLAAALTDEIGSGYAVFSSVALHPPEGRLTLVTATPVMVSTQSAKTTIYYTQYLGQLLPSYDGTNTRMVSFGTEVSIALDSNSGHTGYQQSGKNFDVFWDDAGARLVTGPAWTNDTTRATALEYKNGFLCNAASMTAKFDTTSSTATIAQDRGLYLGTFRASADGQTSFTFGASAASGGTAGNLLLWNCYNRVNVASMTLDADGSHTYNSATARGWGNFTTTRTSYLYGLNEDPVSCDFFCTISTAGANCGVNIGVDSTSVASGINGGANTSSNQNTVASYTGYPGLGFHFLQVLEVGAVAVATFYSTAVAPWQAGLRTQLRM